MKTLAKEHPLGMWFQTAPGVWAFQPANSTGYWETYADAIFVSSNYFDLAGMSMDDKTLFFEAAGVQTALAPNISNPTPGDSVLIADFMTTSPLTVEQVSQVAVFGNFAPAPLSFEQTIYGQINQWVIHLDTGTWGSFTLDHSSQVGSMMPTASDRIYSYRVVIPTMNAAATNLVITQARHILRAIAKEESDHEYMMRLLRSYQLQQEPDVD